MGVYNRYIPEGSHYTPVEPHHHSEYHPEEKLGSTIRDMMKKLPIDKLDSGDILLLLIVLLLWKESEDSDLLLALGAAMLLGREDA